MLDSARHYQPPQFIKRLIDMMALHKLNVLHWHLTDDQGWRLEIKKYPRLTEIGAWRIPAGTSWPTSPDPATGRPPVYGGYYSQQEAREIVAYAAERFVTIVPEIDMPGHAQAAIASYPHLGTGGPPPTVSSDWGVHDFLFNADEPTMSFLEDVLAEVIAIFPGKFIHIGGDEAVKNRWKESPRVQARMHELGLADETALQGWFVARIGRFLESHGRQLIGWDEILESGVPQDAVVMSWRGMDGGVAAARAGHDVVMAPSPTLYLDHWQSDLPDEPPGRPAVISLEDIYSFEPAPPGLAPADSMHILGTQANAWTEHMRTPERVEHQTFPRAAALAEVAWSPPGARDWASFQARLPAQFARYRELELNYADSAFAPRFDIAAGDLPTAVHVTLSKQAAFGTIRFTQDGTEPSPASAAYERGFDAADGSIVKAAVYDGEGLLGGPVALVVERKALRRRTDQQLAQCTGKLVLRLEDDAPLDGERAVFNVDIVDPCWIWRDADLSQGGTFRAAVGQLPFNFQIGKDALSIRRGDARTAAGELELFDGGCKGEPLAVLPLGVAADNPGVTVIGPARVQPRAGHGDLCLRFARPKIDPIWVIQWIEISP
jgi:hexosaminidase